MQTGQSRHAAVDAFAVPALRKDGATISDKFSAVLLENEDQIIGMVAILRDVTKRFDEMRALRRRLADVSMTPTKRA